MSIYDRLKSGARGGDADIDIDHVDCAALVMRWALEWKRTRIDGHAPVEPLTMKGASRRWSSTRRRRPRSGSTRRRA